MTRTTHRGFFALWIALFLVAGLVQAREGPVLELVAIGMLEVGPDGSVLDYALENDLDPAVATLVDRTVRGWRFEPVLVDGTPVIAVTRMRLDLEAVPRGDEYALRVADVSLGAPAPSTRQPPEYPPAALDEHLGAEVSVLVQVDADGKVEDVHVEQVSLSESLGKRTERFRGYFADASVEAARTWTFDMGEIIDGEPMPARLRVPVSFGMQRANGWTERKAYIPGPYHPSPWVDPDAAADDIGMLAQGDVQPLDSRVKLIDDVIGTML
ncbi:MAG TPA: energy transducer TonB [Xanthomonadaceae bacterium]|nr:energy transducer TonB [Xanthomonadaceae bacterium]